MRLRLKALTFRVVNAILDFLVTQMIQIVLHVKSLVAAAPNSLETAAKMQTR